MPGDRPEGAAAPQPAADSGHLYDGLMGHLRQLRDTTGSVVKKGYEESKEIANSDTAQKIAGHVKDATRETLRKGHEIAQSPTTHRIAGQLAEAGNGALHTGQEIARNPTTQRIAGQVVIAGEQVAQDHVRKVHGVIDAGKRGDINGVVRNGLPLASEALIGPAGAALMIGRDKGGQILMDNVPAEHRDTVRKIKGAVDLATSKHTLPDLIIHGTEQSSKY